MMARLSRATLARANSGPWLPPADPTAVRIGVLHFGPGAFHRAHQAGYFDRWLDRDPRWGICAVALRGRSAVDALTAQDGLYTLVTLGDRVEYRIVRALREVRLASDPSDRVLALARFEDPAVRIVTLTITEKGYCLGADGALDPLHPDVIADCADPQRPVGAIGWLVEGLRRRRATGHAPPTVMSCDNLAGNGTALRGAVLALAARRDRSLADWIAGEVRFPCSMVDSITPAATPELRQRVQQTIGLDDLAAVQRESYCRWVLEASACNGVPELAALGVTLTNDVAAHERAKLRIVNGAHSALAYLGLLCGFESVGEAVADPALARHVRAMLLHEVAPGLPGDLAPLVEATLARFANPLLHHELAQIACDGSQKLPYRVLGPITENLASGRPIERLAATLAAWLAFLRQAAEHGSPIHDPLAERLRTLGLQCNGDAAHDVARLLVLRNVFPADLATEPRFVRAVEDAYRALARPDPRRIT